MFCKEQIYPKRIIYYKRICDPLENTREELEYSLREMTYLNLNPLKDIVDWINKKLSTITEV